MPSGRASPPSRSPYLEHLPLSVHALVLLPEFSGLDRFPPVSTLLVPAHGSCESVLERVLRLPAQDARDLRRIERVAAVVSGTILDVADERSRLAGELEDARRDL